MEARREPVPVQPPEDSVFVMERRQRIEQLRRRAEQHLPLFED
jgi:hypothetical protein